VHRRQGAIAITITAHSRPVAFAWPRHGRLGFSSSSASNRAELRNPSVACGLQPLVAVKYIWLLLAVAACASKEPVCGDGEIDDETEFCDDGNHVGGDGCNAICIPEQPVTVSWEFYPSLGGPPLVGACRAGVEKIEMVNTVNQVSTVPCDDKRSTQIFVPWSEQVLVRLRAADGTIVADSLPQTPMRNSVTAKFYEDAGYVRASYRFGQTCTESTFGGEMVLTAADGTQTYEQLACSVGHLTGYYVSKPRRAGVYDVELVTTFGNARIAGLRIGDNNAITEIQVDLE
jgi:cysteine-rich repeat protein